MGKLLSASVGKVSVGDILTALIVLAVCLMAVRLLMKLARRLLSASKLAKARSTSSSVHSLPP